MRNENNAREGARRKQQPRDGRETLRLAREGYKRMAKEDLEVVRQLFPQRRSSK